MTRREAPTYEQIADAIQTAFDSSLIEIVATQDGQDAALWQVARCLDKAGLIDWSGVRPDRAKDDVEERVATALYESAGSGRVGVSALTGAPPVDETRREDPMHGGDSNTAKRGGETGGN